MKQAITSALQALVLLVSFSISAALFALPHYPELRMQLSDVLLRHTELLTQAGFDVLGVSLFLLIGFHWVNRGYYLVLNMGKNTLEVDEKIIWQTLAPILEKKFESQLHLQEVTVEKGKRIAFSVQFDSVSEERQEAVLLEAETELETLLRERFGYRRPFLVNIIS